MMEKKQRLKICFTSDLHGYFYPTSYGDMLEKEMGLFRCFPGFAKDEDTLIIDGGDILQGSAFSYYCKEFQKSSQPMADIMNACGYDFVTIGNHDFNYGLDYLKEYLSGLNATCVCQNVTDQEGNPMFPYEIKTMPNGLKVALIGIVTDFVNVWEKEENIKDIIIGDPMKAMKEALCECRNKADLVIGIYHGGFECDLANGERLSDTTENIGYQLCQELDLDVLLTGHQHMSVEGRYIHNTYVVQNCEYGKEYQFLDIVKEDHGFVITSEKRKADAVMDPTISSQFDVVERKVQEWLNEPTGHLNRDLKPFDKAEMALNGSSIATFLNMVQLYFSKAQISAVGLANEIAGFNKEVKTRDIIATYPYQNTLVVCEITGASLKAAMERSAEYFQVTEDGKVAVADSFLIPKIEHYNYDYFYGIDYTIQPKNPIGSRIEGLVFEGKEVKPEDTFTLCINSYRASGAGGYPMYPECKVIKEINIEMVELIMEYFRLHPMVVV